MKLSHKTYPCKYHPTWEVLDSSKITCYMTCPRKYFFRYVLGWEPDGSMPNINLIFGEAWHRAMEIILRDRTAVIEAEEAATAYYRQFIPPADDGLYKAKQPSSFTEGLITWLRRFKDYDFETLHTEVSGSAPISDNEEIVFRLDAVIRDFYGVKVIDHKTSGSSNKIYADVFPLSVQMNAYTHAAVCNFPDEDIWGLVVNRSVFMVSKIEHEWIPIRRNVANLGVWLEETLDTVHRIRAEFDNLSYLKDSDPSLHCFYRNTESCTKYFSLCPYFHLCLAWLNPLQSVGEVPAGFKVSYWDPSKGGEE